MRWIISPLLFLTLVIGACSTSVPTPQPFSASPTIEAMPGVPSNTTITNGTLPAPESATTAATPHIDQPPDEIPTATQPEPEPCAYMWATQNLTDLTLNLQAALKVLHPDAQGYAFAFGEDCIHQDGTRTFLAMETDFNVTLPVADLTDENGLGEWIVNIMQMIEDLPAEKIVGPRPGRVTVIFSSGTDQTYVQFYIDKYQALPGDMEGWELFQALQAKQ